MAPRKPPTPEELWNELENEAHDRGQIDQIAALPREELDARLEKAGFDVTKVKAEASALRDEIARSAAARRAKLKAVEEQRRQGAQVAARVPLWRRPVVAVAAAASLAAAAGGGLLFRPIPAPLPVWSGSPPPSASSVDAAELRTQAFAACAEWRWQECRALLDDASRIDPAGESAPDVQAARKRAEWGLLHPEEKPPK
jgi:hypothetical protein